MEEKKKPKKFNKKTWLTSGLRRMSYRWPPRTEATKRGRKDRGLYECAMCHGLFKNGEYILDHVNPVVPLEGFPMHPETGEPDWTIFINRLFCDIDGYQILCKTCSDSKTMIEDNMREFYKKEKKSVDKKGKKE